MSREITKIISLLALTKLIYQMVATEFVEDDEEMTYEGKYMLMAKTAKAF